MKKNENLIQFEIESKEKKRVSVLELDRRKTKISLLECDFNISETLEKVLDFLDWEYDYEIGSCKLEDDHLKVPKKSKTSIKFEPLVFDKVNDSVNIELNNSLCSVKGEKVKKANCLKRLVSLKKRRFENAFFDLDMAYITQRVVAMGYPSTGCESMYRNSLYDIHEFIRHYKINNKTKIYNLCIEKDRVYPKSNFSKTSSLHFHECDPNEINCLVGFFPFPDHNPPPIKLILEFCIDLCIYLIKVPDSIALVHCKAGKGRTGLMIVSYLVFSELCKSAEEAMKHYAYMRTHNNKGITIPSQIRFVKYFEMFLRLNYQRPYIKMIPKIIKTQFKNSMESNNMIANYLRDKSYFLSPNMFKLKEIKIGPFESKVKLGITLFNNELKELKFSADSLLEEEIINSKVYYYFNFVFNSKVSVQTDIRFDVKGLFKFSFWLNLWYSTVDHLHEVMRTKNVFNTASESIETSTGTPKSNSQSTINKKSEENLANLRAYLDSFNTNSDLNEFLSLINNCLSDTSQTMIDKTFFKIELDKSQLDKFKEAKTVLNDFKVLLIYELIGGVNN